MPSVLLKLTISGQQGKQRLEQSVETETSGQVFCKCVNVSPKHQVHDESPPSWLGNAAASKSAE